MILADVIAQLNPFGVSVIEELRQHFDPKKLADFFIGRHFAQRFVGPLPVGFVEMDRSRLLKMVFAFIFGRGRGNCYRQQDRRQQEMSEHAIDNSKS